MFFLSQDKINFFKETLRFLTHNFWLKFLSVVFSVFLFFIVRTDKEVVFERTAKVRIITPNQITVNGGSLRYINVNVRLENSLFSTPPSEQELTGSVVIEQKSPQKLSLKITRENFLNLPSQYILSIDRPYIEIETDITEKKKIIIMPTIQGEIDKDHFVTLIKVQPDNIEITGSRSELAKINSIKTLPVNVQGLTSNLQTAVQIEKVPDLSIDYYPNNVQVSVTVIDKLEKKSEKGKE